MTYTVLIAYNSDVEVEAETAEEAISQAQDLMAELRPTFHYEIIEEDDE